MSQWTYLNKIFNIGALGASIGLFFTGCSGGGNGGGYGGELPSVGLIPTDNGTYTSASPSSAGALSPTPSPYYYLVGTHTGCSNYPSGWQAIGPDVIGVIGFSNTGDSYASSLCGAYSSIVSSTVKTVDFDTNVAIYNNQIFQHFSGNPPLLASLKTPVAYCVTSSLGTQGLEVGTDVLIYNQNGTLYSQLYYGTDVGSTPTLFSVAPFQVTQSATLSQATFLGSYFELDIARNGSAATTGALNVTIAGSAQTLAMSCWLTTP